MPSKNGNTNSNKRLSNSKECPEAVFLKIRESVFTQVLSFLIFNDSNNVFPKQLLFSSINRLSE